MMDKLINLTVKMSRLEERELVIIGNYGAMNLGDEAILAGVLREIKKESWQIEVFGESVHLEVTVLSYNPWETRRIHGVESHYLLPFGVRSWLRGIFQLEFFKTLMVLKKADLVLMGGGGLFSDESWMAIRLWSFQIAWARFFRKPFVMYGQSVGPLRSRWARKKVGRIFEAARSITVRDEKSRDFLKKCSVSKEIKVQPDAALGLKGAAEIENRAGQMREWLSENSLKKYSFVVVALRRWAGFTHEKQHELARFLDWISQKHSLGIVFVPFCQLGQNDELVEQEVFQLMKKKEAVVLRPYDNDFWMIMALIKEAKMLIGMRLHSLIFSEIVGTAIIGIAYSEKVSSFLRSIGKEGQGIELKELSFEGFCEIFAVIESLEIRFNK